MIPARQPAAAHPTGPAAALSLIPGFALCVAVTLTAWLAQSFELRLLDRAWVETLVLAILIGAAIRSIWTPPAIMRPGVEFTARTLLEVAIVLLGGSVSAATVMAIGPGLLLGTALVVAAAIGVSYALGRLFRLPRRMAVLIACGNAICGNSAIAAVAPVIGAEKEDVASSIAFTAVLGVIVVLTLPLLVPLLGFSHYQYGALAGMTVYAVPQVLAATFPVSALSGEVGTLVKLVRVLLLGPVVVFFAFRAHKVGEQKLATGAFIPWFIVGFLVLAAARSLGFIPVEVAAPVREVSRWMTVAAMAALGLGVDVRVLGKVGGRVVLAVTGSLIVLISVSATLITLLGIG